VGGVGHFEDGGPLSFQVVNTGEPREPLALRSPSFGLARIRKASAGRQFVRGRDEAAGRQFVRGRDEAAGRQYVRGRDEAGVN
jgi:hypothetical protein